MEERRRVVWSIAGVACASAGLLLGAVSITTSPWSVAAVVVGFLAIGISILAALSRRRKP